ncbi:GGDEF domain-containing protein [Sphingobium phenoxybenzoativorans]|uniref:GGDEF domain-containing protein n=1 Tax=Sphingobium phenoxybenzoativorans TaxID=1592790 RepID=UPI0008728C0C|nr:GGDEF domain-containing protein [Sphingobium phenoxybenzoativorans]
MDEHFAFLLPIIMAVFGGAFLFAWRWGARNALPWGAGYLCGGVAFCIPVIAPYFPSRFWALLADALFATSFYLYGQGILQHAGAKDMRLVRMAIWAVSVGLCAFAIFGSHSLRLELAASDLGCFLLIALPLGVMARRMRRKVDHALFAAVSLVALDTLSRGTTVMLTTPSDQRAAFLSTDYAFLMQVLASMLAPVMALTALAASVSRVVADYQRDAFTDPLTGLLNRRGFWDAVALRERRGKVPGCVVICDIDHFKRINDAHGHAVGDAVITAFAATIRADLPPGAIAARFGGEEFLIHLPRTRPDEAVGFAQAVRRAFAGADWDGTGISYPLTASFGLSEYLEDDSSLEVAIERADLAMYEAKLAGRDKVRIMKSNGTGDMVPEAPAPQLRLIAG